MRVCVPTAKETIESLVCDHVFFSILTMACKGVTFAQSLKTNKCEQKIVTISMCVRRCKMSERIQSIPMKINEC